MIPPHARQFNGGVVSAMQKKKILGGHQPVRDGFEINDNLQPWCF
jgi:hypothetical protein